MVLRVWNWKKFLVQTPLCGEKERGNVDEILVGDRVCSKSQAQRLGTSRWAPDEIVVKVRTQQLTIPNQDWVVPLKVAFHRPVSSEHDDVHDGPEGLKTQ